MEHKSISAACKYTAFFAILLATPLATPRAQAQTFSVIYSFTGGADGGNPVDGFLIGPAGYLFGTASTGGSDGAGVVFKLTETGVEKVLYNFTGGADGANPNSRLIFDAAGNLYGTTFAGGAYGAGTVFKLTQAGEETVLHSFGNGADGANPIAKLTFDAVGNLYGTTSAGGAYGGGTVFEVSKAGAETVLHSFGSGTDGSDPVAGVTVTKKGEIFGTTSTGAPPDTAPSSR